MFIIRQATIDDMGELLKLSRLVHSFNLPQDKDALAAKIARSRRSFAGQAASEREREFVFVLEDTESRSVIGTSSVYSCISWPGHPHLFFRVRKREHYSDDLGTGQVHVTIQLDTDESGPSEVGGLILAPGYRRHPERLGWMLSMVRFHFMGLHKRDFKQRILAEMMGALTPDSRSSLWDYLGRRFINLSYTEADTFNQRSKEFITSLFPRTEIYLSLLPPEARRLVGTVGDETQPALRMLERIGFVNRDHVDPFDGGPYLEAQRDEIPVVRSTFARKLVAARPKGRSLHAIVSAHGNQGFKATRSRVMLAGDGVWMPSDAVAVLSAKVGERIGVTLIDAQGNAVDPASPARVAKGRRGGAAARPRPARGSATPMGAAPVRRSGRRR
jgi:arginine N-succinyltransferase